MALGIKKIIFILKPQTTALSKLHATDTYALQSH